MRAVLLCCALLIPVAGAKEPRHWQAGTIIRAEQPKRNERVCIEIWNPTFTHWYTVATASQVIKATEMVPPDVKWRPRGDEVCRQPPMSFRIGEQVKFALQELPPEPKKTRELYVLDRNGEEHTLTIDEIVPKDR